MIAAVYARKSTEQTGVADEHRSVARQVTTRARMPPARHEVIRGNVAEARTVLEVALRDRIRFRPIEATDGTPS